MAKAKKSGPTAAESLYAEYNANVHEYGNVTQAAMQCERWFTEHAIRMIELLEANHVTRRRIARAMGFDSTKEVTAILNERREVSFNEVGALSYLFTETFTLSR